MEQKKITLSVISGDRVLATACGSGKVVLVYDSEYLPGDAIRIETDQAGYFVIQLEDGAGRGNECGANCSFQAALEMML